MLDAALALDQHVGDLAAQLLDLTALFWQSGEPKIAVMAHQALDHGIGRRHRTLEQAGIKPDAGPGMADPDVVAHDLRAGVAFRRRFVRQLRQQDLLRGPTRIAEPDAHEVAREGDRPVAFLPVRHHQRIDIVRIHKYDPVADFHAVRGRFAPVMQSTFRRVNAALKLSDESALGQPAAVRAPKPAVSRLSLPLMRSSQG